MSPEEIRQIVAAVIEGLEQEGLVCKRHPNAPFPAQEYYSIKTCAYVAGVSSDHIRRAVVGFVLPASDVGTKDHPLYRIHKNDLAKFMEERKSGARPPIARSTQKSVSRHHKQKKSAV